VADHRARVRFGDPCVQGLGRREPSVWINRPVQRVTVAVMHLGEDRQATCLGRRGLGRDCHVVHLAIIATVAAKKPGWFGFAGLESGDRFGGDAGDIRDELVALVDADVLRLF
jgi:hypothetical protein